jgi:hypothetical protein
MSVTLSIRRLILACSVTLAGLSVGCALPDYHLPSGFSSTYYRHLQEAQTMPADAVVETGDKPRWWWR